MAMRLEGEYLQMNRVEFARLISEGKAQPYKLNGNEHIRANKKKLYYGEIFPSDNKFLAITLGSRGNVVFLSDDVEYLTSSLTSLVSDESEEDPISDIFVVTTENLEIELLESRYISHQVFPNGVSIAIDFSEGGKSRLIVAV